MLCQAAGATALPYPLVEELLAIDGARLAMVNPQAPRIDHGDLAGDWIAADLDGTRYQVQPSSRTGAKLGPFLVPATLSQPDGTVPAADVDLHLNLGSWRILGAVQQALRSPDNTSPTDAVRQAARPNFRRSDSRSPTHQSLRVGSTNSPSTPSAERNLHRRKCVQRTP